MSGVVIYGTGSPILVDVEESLRRAGIPVRAGVRNRECESYLSGDSPAFAPDAVPAELKKLPFLVPLFTPGHRREAAREAEELGFSEPFGLIDPTVPVPSVLRYEGGLYVNAGCTLGAASEFGAFVFINRGASVGHHSRLDRFVSIGPGAVLAAFVTMGKGAVVGAGAVVLPKITIGENAVVGAGAVVTHDVPAHCLVLGNPARISRSDLAGYNGVAVD